MKLPAGFTKEGDFVRCERDGSLLAVVREGPFYMGAAEDDVFVEEDEKPERQVQLESFLMDLVPVTNEMFERFIRDGGYERKELWDPAGWEWRLKNRIEQPQMWGVAGWNRPRQPAAGVSWYEADAYARWAGRSLPTEAQWEKAARGVREWIIGSRIFPWGETFPSPRLSNYGRSVGCTTDVGSYPEGASPWGCQDMAGNVNNWCLDWYWKSVGEYCAEKRALREPLLDDSLAAQLNLPVVAKVDRGGGWATSKQAPEVLSCTYRTAWAPDHRESWHGFRTALRL